MRKKIYCHFCATRLTEKEWEGRLRFFCEGCNDPLYENPIPATCLVVPDDKGRVLLVKRNVDPRAGYWCLPGGFMELGETPEASALRELKEETGLSGRIGTLLGITSSPSDQYDTVIVVAYSIREYSGSPVAGDDASDVAYFGPDELPEIAFGNHAEFIRRYYAMTALNP